MYKFTAAERARIKLWLEKHYKSRDKGATLRFTTDAGQTVHLRRIAQYLPGGVWKIRTAFIAENGYPVMTTGPLVATDDHKGKNDKYVMVPKTPKPAKVAANPGAFAAALDAEIKAQAAHIKHYLQTPNPIWDWYKDLPPAGSAEADYTTFKIHTDHDKHVAVHKKAAKKAVKKADK